MNDKKKARKHLCDPFAARFYLIGDKTVLYFYIGSLRRGSLPKTFIDREASRDLYNHTTPTLPLRAYYADEWPRADVRPIPGYIVIFLLVTGRTHLLDSTVGTRLCVRQMGHSIHIR